MSGLHVADLLVRGRITWDDNEDGRLPMLVIDGKEISWEHFGQFTPATDVAHSNRVTDEAKRATTASPARS
jgi:hypothetical protein